MPITLDGTTGITAPGVTDTGNLSVTGTSTLTGAVSQTSSSTAASFIPTGSTAPANGMYLSAANTLDFATNTTNQVSISSGGIVTGTAGNLMLVQGTAQASTSGTSITFSSIPSWVKRVTVNISGVSTNGTSLLRFRIGPVAGVETSGYLGSTTGFAATTLASIQFTAGFDVNDGATAAAVRNGSFVFSLLDAATNTWSMSGTQGQSNTNNAAFIGGSKPLAGTLSVLSMTTINGTDTFDAGKINIQYE